MVHSCHCQQQCCAAQDVNKLCRRAALAAKMAARKASSSSDDGGGAPAPARTNGLFSRETADEPTGLAPAMAQQRVDVRQDFAQKRQEALARQAAHAKAQAEEADALDAFMDEAVLPAVAARDAAVRRRAWAWHCMAARMPDCKRKQSLR